MDAFGYLAVPPVSVQSKGDPDTPDDQHTFFLLNFAHRIGE
jgi:hypothetical protein